ncbi:MAG: FmdB family zinc ribbon protein [Acidimicrobiia bacterium]
MPTYEYACKQCGENIEIFQSFSEKPLKKHNDCGGELKKVFHARGIVFKGSGFYATGNRSSGAPKPSEKSGTSTKTSSESKSKSQQKSQSKPKASSSTSKDS